MAKVEFQHFISLSNQVLQFYFRNMRFALLPPLAGVSDDFTVLSGEFTM